MHGSLRVASRALLSAIFISSGYGMLRQPSAYAKRAAAALPIPEADVIPRAYGATMLTAGTTLALGILPAASAGVLALTLLPNTYVGHPFWKEEEPGARRGQKIHFLKNVGLLGGLLAVILEELSRKRA